MTYKKYEDYKNCFNYIVDDIPVNWEICKMKHFCTVKDGTHDTPKYIEKGECSYPLITSKDIINGEIVFNDCKYISESDFININKRSDVKQYDVIMPMIGTIGNPAIVISEKNFSIKNLALFKTNLNFYKAKFIKYILESSFIDEQINLLTRGGVQNFVSLTILNNLFIINPNEDLDKIVRFLDKKTSEIDTLIEEKEKLIELLKEKREAIITEAITKGIDKNVKMKDSGVEWIGVIPESWNISKIKYSTYVKGRIGWQGLKSEEFIDEGPYLVTGTDFENGRIDWNKCYHISEERYNEAIPIQLRENDLLITKDGTIGKIAIVTNKPNKAILNSGIFVTRCLNSEYYTEFMYFILNSKVFSNYIKYMETGSTIKHLYQETFENFKYMLPNKSEQMKIVDYIKNKVKNLDEIINKITLEINLLNEYKKSLVSEVITGKIDIRNEV